MSYMFSLKKMVQKMVKNRTMMILLGLLLLLTIGYYYYFKPLLEHFDNNTIVSKLGQSAGFYSQLFFLINHYIYCKENKKNFKIDSENWIYKSKNGWTDYFKPIELNFYESSKFKKIYSHNDIIENYTIQSYKNVIPEIYVYNENIKNNINKIKNKYNLTDYDSIYIRRGDKLVSEIKLSEESKYIELLLKKNPNCKTIFLQTDDYNCFTNLQKYIKNNMLNIRLVTICNENSVGAITNNQYKQELNNPIKENYYYISKIKDKLNNTTSIENMNSQEKYEHTLELLTGIDICMNSNNCVCDFGSNVSRFIKLTHKNPNNVFDINNTNVDFSKKFCPAFSF